MSTVQPPPNLSSIFPAKILLATCVHSPGIIDIDIMVNLQRTNSLSVEGFKTSLFDIIMSPNWISDTNWIKNIMNAESNEFSKFHVSLPELSRGYFNCFLIFNLINL